MKDRPSLLRSLSTLTSSSAIRKSSRYPIRIKRVTISRAFFSGTLEASNRSSTSAMDKLPRERLLTMRSAASSEIAAVPNVPVVTPADAENPVIGLSIPRSAATADTESEFGTRESAEGKKTTGRPVLPSVAFSLTSYAPLRTGGLVSRATGATCATGLGSTITPSLSRIRFSISAATSGLSMRNCRAFSLPWPSWSPS